MVDEFSEQEIPEQYNGKIKRLRNIPRFKDFSDWELYQIVLRKEKVKEEKQLTTGIDDASAAKLNKRFETKLAALQKEFGVDMNDANDAESLRQLIRFLIQQEDTDQDIRRVKEELKGDPVTLSRTLKSYGDFQRSLTMSINELQEKLGINRKARKEKQTDDIPQYIESLRKRAQDFWNRSTTPITCSSCLIELARVWINFPEMEHEIEARFVCWKCKEQILWKT